MRDRLFTDDRLSPSKSTSNMDSMLSRDHSSCGYSSIPQAPQSSLSRPVLSLPSGTTSIMVLPMLFSFLSMILS